VGLRAWARGPLTLVEYSLFMGQEWWYRAIHPIPILTFRTPPCLVRCHWLFVILWLMVGEWNIIISRGVTRTHLIAVIHRPSENQHMTTTRIGYRIIRIIHTASRPPLNRAVAVFVLLEESSRADNDNYSWFPHPDVINSRLKVA